MSNKVFAAVMAVIVIVVGAVFVLNSSDEAEPELSSEDIEQVTAIDERNYRVEGPEDAPVQLVEYADFACGFCAQAYPEVEQLLAEFPDDIVYEFKPLSIPAGGNSVLAHRAAEAAGMQDNFFGMTDLLFRNQQIWTQSTDGNQLFNDYAAQLGLDIEQFEADLTAAETLDIINDYKSEATSVGVTGTPAFFINGQRIETSGQYYAPLKAEVERILAEQS